MREARLIETRDIPLDEIDGDTRLRKVSEAAVESLQRSIEQLGVMMDEIHVRKLRHKGGKLKLMAGGHRLATARAMGWETIRAKVWDCTDDWAELLEIDDNLAHSELAPLELAVFLSRRKAIYERLHPETKNGGVRGNQHTGGRQNDVMSFCQSVAEKRDLSRRQIERLVKAGSALSEEEVATLGEADKPTTLNDLLALSKITDVPLRRAVIARLQHGTEKNVRAAVEAIQPTQAAAKDPVEEGLKTLRQAWARAPKEARRRFVEAENVEIFSFLDELDAGLGA